MWAYESVFYQIYPLGILRCAIWEWRQRGKQDIKGNRLDTSYQKAWCQRYLFSPVFDSDTHGYNTRDYRKIDCRLGTNEDFAKVCKELHENGIKVVLDGVFNHVGRASGFQDVLKTVKNSPYKDWFHINFGGNSNYKWRTLVWRLGGSLRPC